MVAELPQRGPPDLCDYQSAIHLSPGRLLEIADVNGDGVVDTYVSDSQLKDPLRGFGTVAKRLRRVERELTAAIDWAQRRLHHNKGEREFASEYREPHGRPPHASCLLGQTHDRIRSDGNQRLKKTDRVH